MGILDRMKAAPVLQESGAKLPGKPLEALLKRTEKQQEDNELTLDIAALSDFDPDALPLPKEFSEFDEPGDDAVPVIELKRAESVNGTMPDFGIEKLPPLPHEHGRPYEHSPRITLIRMLQETQIGEEFRVKAPPGKGRDYLQAMRQVLSRARALAIKEKRPLTRFKLFCDKVISTAEYDELVLYRGRHGEGRKGAYDELLGLV